MEMFRNLGEFSVDVLKEVGNIGAGHAATALSRLLNKPVDMAVPSVRMLGFDEIADQVGGPEQIVIATFLRVEGDVPGNLFYIMKPPAASKLISSLLGMESNSTSEQYSDMELSALAEIGNILAGSYLSSLADFTNLNMMPMVPALAIDMAGAILSFGLMQFGQMGDGALLIDTMFLEGDEEVEGQFFFIPDPESFAKIFRALGVPFE